MIGYITRSTSTEKTKLKVIIRNYFHLLVVVIFIAELCQLRKRLEFRNVAVRDPKLKSN